jgi:peptidylprolyl isomerase
MNKLYKWYISRFKKAAQGSGFSPAARAAFSKSGIVTMPHSSSGFLGLLLLLIAGAASCSPRDDALGDGLFARITTDKGDIVVRLEYQKTPLTVCNFAGLAEGTLAFLDGRPFYNGLTFHRVEENFVIQGGDPLGNSQGGPGYSFPDEIDASLTHDGPGVLSMANAGPNTNGSQFFITHRATPHLDGRHTVFGRVVEGQQVVNAIRVGDVMEQITIIRNGSDAKAFKTDQAAFDRYLATARAAYAAKQEARRSADLALINSKYPGLIQNPSGLCYQILKAGNGPKAGPGKTVSLSYKGMFVSGEVFDGSDFTGKLLEFTVGSGMVIPGFDEAAGDMRQGEKRLVVLPPELAYGERGAGGVIPPNAFLVFEMELVRMQ